MTAEDARYRLHLEAELWTLRCLLSDAFQALHLSDDYAAYEVLHERHKAYQVDRLLAELEDTNPSLAAAIDDREFIPASVLL
ncbi:MAG: hypothetical protein KF712_09805 [Akkermansiaceae bacterium]|nr:hypothetical protein [Akkermansiaceae bacterium]